ncbi:MAG: esterase-like activity of phytase family protein [Pseudomonadota bacterium]|nr:esterase-like activity of phytase family protein [Pseudomonadota bacterium]
MALPILATAMWNKAQPSRWPAPERVVDGRAVPVTMARGVKAWQLSAADPRFGGLSALAVEGGTLVALTDAGVVARFAPPMPGQHFRIALRDLPGGPGSQFRKSGRDSESLLADRNGRGWWVGFENRHSLYLFSRDFGRVLARRSLKVKWRANRGGEALVQGAAGVMVLPEGGGRAARGNMTAPAWNSDATRLPDGRLILLIRRPRLLGFDNQLWIASGAGRPARRIALDLGMLDNMEGIAAAPLSDGGTRLWIVSDNNFRPWMRTLLVALDLGPDA